MLQLAPALQDLCRRHRISDSLPLPIFVERCVEALAVDASNSAEVAKSAAIGILARQSFIPNPGIVRDERIDTASPAATQSPPDNSCFDSVFPRLED